MIPIGEAHNGTRFSGYCCRNADGPSGYLLLFREQTKSDGYTFRLLVSLAGADLTVIYGSAPAEIIGMLEDSLQMKFSEQRTFIWIRCAL